MMKVTIKEDSYSTHAVKMGVSSMEELKKVLICAAEGGNAIAEIDLTELKGEKEDA